MTNAIKSGDEDFFQKVLQRYAKDYNNESKGDPVLQIAQGEESFDFKDGAKSMNNTLIPRPTIARQELSQEWGDDIRSRSAFPSVCVREIKAPGYRISTSLNDDMSFEKQVDDADGM